MASVVSQDDRPLSEQIASVKRYVQSGEINFRVRDKQEKLDRLAEKFADARVDRLDGLTMEYDDWWFNVRPSNTEPLLRLNLEATDRELLLMRLGQIQAILGEPVEE